MTDILAPLRESWLDRGYGAPLVDPSQNPHHLVSPAPECVLTHMVWADNIWLFTLNADVMRTMIQETQHALATADLTMDLSEASFLSPRCECTSLRVSSPIGDGRLGWQVVMRKPEIKVLGTKVAANHRSTTTIQFRLEQAWKAFWAHKYIFRNGSLNRVQKLRLLEKLIQSILLWGAAVWAPSRKDLYALASAQLRMYRLTTMSQRFARHE